jgi:hypothetical protein
MEYGFIVNIHYVSEDLLIFGDYHWGCFCYDVKGNEVELDKIKEHLYFMNRNSIIEDVKNKCNLLRFEETYN